MGLARKEVKRMARVREMQGVPAHLEYLKSDGKRRHPSHCIYADGKGSNRICTSTESPIYNQVCHSSKYCDFYREKTNNQ